MTPEPYIDAHALADCMGVSRSTIKRWVRAGMPSQKWGARTRRFRASECIAWANGRNPTTLQANHPSTALGRPTAAG